MSLTHSLWIGYKIDSGCIYTTRLSVVNIIVMLNLNLDYDVSERKEVNSAVTICVNAVNRRDKRMWKMLSDASPGIHSTPTILLENSQFSPNQFREPSLFKFERQFSLPW